MQDKYQNSTNPINQVMGTAEAAEVWGLSESAVKQLCQSGKIKAKLIGRTWVIATDEPNPKVGKGNQSMSAKKRMLKLLKENVGEIVDRDKLAEVAKVHDWARALRTLRQEGWQLEAVSDGYILHSLEQENTGKKRVNISGKLRYQVLQRDDSKCQRCGATVQDGVQLDVDHKMPVEWGGETELDNLWTLCQPCNLGKKHWFADQDDVEMKQIMKETSAQKRIAKLFELNPGVFVPSVKIGLVAAIQDWPRSIRAVRSESGMDIRYEPNDGEQGYVYYPEED